MSHSTIAVTEDNFEAEVLQSTVPVIVDFWAPWCGPCLRLGPILDEIVTESHGSLKIVKINIEESQTLPAQYGVRSIPFLLYFKDGVVKDQSVGLESKDAILARVTALA